MAPADRPCESVRYLDLLELIFVIKRIPAWSSNLTTCAIATPKLTVTDSGLGGQRIGTSEERAKDRSDARLDLRGPMGGRTRTVRRSAIQTGRSTGIRHDCLC